MKKTISIIVLIVAAVLFPIHAYAHPGGTDYKGGHYNRSTGEYHYHHGYSAHQHKDIDGDGTLDCPYDFDEKTTHQSAMGKKVQQQPLITWHDTPTCFVLISLFLLFMFPFFRIIHERFAESLAVFAFRMLILALFSMMIFSFF